MPRQLLKNKVKPIFSTHSHPDINPETGRKLLRPAGGEPARQDMFEGQNWKEYDGWGSWCVLSWCVEVMSVGVHFLLGRTTDVDTRAIIEGRCHRKHRTHPPAASDLAG